MARDNDFATSVVDLECPDCTDRYYAIVAAFRDGNCTIFVPDRDSDEVEAVKQVISAHEKRDFRLVEVVRGPLRVVGSHVPVKCRLCGTVEEVVAIVDTDTLDCQVLTDE